VSAKQFNIAECLMIVRIVVTDRDGYRWFFLTLQFNKLIVGCLGYRFVLLASNIRCRMGVM